MNETWAKLFNGYIECHKAIGTLISRGVIDDESEMLLRMRLLDEIIATMESEVKD